MDLFQHRYYRLNKTLMTLLGQWPYQSSHARYCFRALIIYINASEMLSRILDIVKNRNDFDVLLDCAVPLFADLVCISNLITLMSNSKRTLQLLNRISTDWQVWSRHREVNILHEYAEQGQKINVVLAVIIYFGIFVDVISLLISKSIDTLLKNGTEPGRFPTHVDYYRVDTQKYYFYVMTYYCMIIVMVIMVIVANNVMLISSVQHACGVFTALGRKLEQIGDRGTSMGTRKDAYALVETDMAHLAWCIDRHNDTIEYANLIEEMNTWNVGFTVMFGTLLFIALAVQINTTVDDLESTARLIIFTSSLLFHFVMDCYVAQKLMDHSINIGFDIYNNQWYNLSLEAQKFVQMTTMRCIIPCQLTAGKILILTMNSCGLTIRAAASYIMIMRSTRGL